MLGEPGEGAVELVVVGAAVLHGAAGLVRDRQNAVNVRVLFEQVTGAEALRDVLVGARRAVDGADDGDVVAAAVTLVVGPFGAAVVTQPGAHLRRAGEVSRRGGRRRLAVAAEAAGASEGGGGSVR